MKTKHTPGPWIAYESDNKREWVIDAGKWGIAVAAGFVGIGSTEANGRLISAAPELLEVAQNILADDLLPYLPAEYIAKVRATIAKATGGQS